MLPLKDGPFPISRRPNTPPQQDQGCSLIVGDRGEQLHIWNLEKCSTDD